MLVLCKRTLIVISQDYSSYENITSDLLISPLIYREMSILLNRDSLHLHHYF